MNNLHIGDFVLYNGYAYEVKEIDGEYVTLETYKHEKPLVVKAITVEYLQPEYMSDEQIRKYYRYEEYYDEVAHRNNFLNIKGIEDFDVTLEDLECALTNFDKTHDFQHFKEFWVNNMYQLLVRQFKQMVPSCNLYSQYSAHRRFLDELSSILNKSASSTNEDLRYMMDYLHDNLFDNIQNLNVPPEKRYYRKRDVEYFIFICSTTNALKFSDQDTIETFKYLITKELEEHNPFAYIASARMHIYPNPAFDVDYAFAKEKLEYLAHNFHGGFSIDAMDLLGDLYFQGYLNDGQPNYEKAFLYYNMATINHHQMAPGKLVRMFYEGLYVPHSDYTAFSIIESVSNDMIAHFLKEFDADNSLPEIMLYKAKLLEDDLHDYNVWYQAYYYLLQADFYLKMRRNIDVPECFSDTRKQIDDYLAVIRNSSHYADLKQNPLANLQQILEFNTLNNGHIFFETIEDKNGKFMTFKRDLKTEMHLDNEGDEYDTPTRIFVVVPEMDFAGFVDELKVEIEDNYNFSDQLFEDKGLINHLKGNSCYFFNDVVLALNPNQYFDDQDIIDVNCEDGFEDEVEDEIEQDKPKLFFDEEDFKESKTIHKLAHIYDMRDPLNGLIVNADGVEDLYAGKIINLYTRDIKSYIRVDDVYEGCDCELLYGEDDVMELKDHISQSSQTSLGAN